MTLASMLCLPACALPNAGRIALATRLTNEAPDYSPEQRTLYVDCGTRALAHIPKARIYTALAAKDQPGMWAVLGSKALDDYVRICREAERKHGPWPAR